MSARHASSEAGQGSLLVDGVRMASLLVSTLPFLVTWMMVFWFASTVTVPGVEFLVVTHNRDLVRARRNEQFLMAIPVMVEFVDVSNEVVDLFAVQKTAALAWGLNSIMM